MAIQATEKANHANKAHVPAKTNAHKNSEVGNIPMTNAHKEKISDEEYAYNQRKKSTVEQRFNKDLKSGKLTQDEMKFKILGFTVSKKFDRYSYKADKDENFGDVSSRYKLPKGALKQQALGEGNSGNLNTCIPEGPVTIQGEDIRASIAASKEHKSTNLH